MTSKLHIEALFQRSITAKQETLRTCLPVMERIANLFVQSIKSGGKLLFCGNGGSAADAQHLAAELLVRLRPKVNRRPISAMAMALDTSSLTACGNDYSFEEFFARGVVALGRPGDVLVGISTSGKSPNICRAFEAAKGNKMQNVGFLGCDGGPAQMLCDEALVVPSEETGRIQEVHITAGHAILEVVEDILLAEEGLICL